MNTAQVDFYKKDILIVDDTPANLRVLSTMLTEQGYKVRKALNGEMALTACQALVPDVILLDIMMPEMDGYEVCQHLKADERTRKVPIIFISALDEALDKVKAFCAGGSDYITKPFQIEEVLVRVQNQLTIQSLHSKLIEQNEALKDINQNLENIVEEKTKQLIEQERAALLGRLTQGIVHNIKNPLQTILLSNDLINSQATTINEEEILELSKYIKIATLQIQKIMDNLLINNRRSQNLDLKLLNVNDIVQNEIQLLMSNLDFKHKIQKKYFYDNKIPSISLIYTHITQVFHNLINNAIDAMWNMSEKEVTIVTRQDETSIYIDVKDTGCGIAPDNISNLFDPFYTSKPAKGEEKEAGEPAGTGLGLYISRELLKIFRGEIAVTSEVGKGSVFTIILPKVAERKMG